MHKNHKQKRNKIEKSQNALEFLSTYIWAFIIIAVVSVVLLIYFNSLQSFSTYFSSQCFITPSFPCSDTLLSSYNSTKPITYQILFTDNLGLRIKGTSILIPENGISISLLNIGQKGTNTYTGNCYPKFVRYGQTVFCSISINGKTEPNINTNIYTKLKLNYSICTNNQSKCKSNINPLILSTTGYSTQIYAPSSVHFYSIKLLTIPSGHISLNNIFYPSNTILMLAPHNYDIFGVLTNVSSSLKQYTEWYINSPSSVSSPNSQLTNVTIRADGTLVYSVNIPAPHISNYIFTYADKGIISAHATLTADPLFLYISNKPLTSSILSKNKSINYTLIAKHNGTINYTICSSSLNCIAVGNYSLKAYDSAANKSTTKLLTINKATPTLSLFNKKAIIKYSISTLNNQVTATLYVNNVAVASTHTSSLYTISSPGTYSIKLATTGNQNYTAANKTSTATKSILSTLIFGGFYGTQAGAVNFYRRQGAKNWWVWPFNDHASYKTLYTKQGYAVIMTEGPPSSNGYNPAIFVVPISSLSSYHGGHMPLGIQYFPVGSSMLYIASMTREYNKYNSSFAHQSQGGSFAIVISDKSTSIGQYYLDYVNSRLGNAEITIHDRYNNKINNRNIIIPVSELQGSSFSGDGPILYNGIKIYFSRIDSGNEIWMEEGYTGYGCNSGCPTSYLGLKGVDITYNGQSSIPYSNSPLSISVVTYGPPLACGYFWFGGGFTGWFGGGSVEWLQYACYPTPSNSYTFTPWAPWSPWFSAN